MAKNNKKYVVIAGWWDNKTLVGNFVQCIGIHDKAETAYGDALLYLNENCSEEKEEMITPLYELECQTGFGMHVKHENHTDYAYVLFCEDEEEEQNEHKTQTMQVRFP